MGGGYTHLIVFGYWVKEGVFFCTLLSTFIRPVYSCALFALFFNTISYLYKKKNYRTFEGLELSDLNLVDFLFP